MVETLQSVRRRYLTMAAAVEYSGLSDKTIRRLIAGRQLTPYRPVRGRILLDLRELENLIQASAGAASTRGTHLQRD